MGTNPGLNLIENLLELETAMSKLLVLSCSQSKRYECSRLPAIQRYDGPSFRLLRRYLKDSDEEIGIYILSAKYGLIPHTRRIPFYDQRMTKHRAQELERKIKGQAQQLFSSELHRQKIGHQLFINLGKDYLQAFEPAYPLFASGSIVTTASGATGKRLANMYDWLYGSDSSLRQPASLELVTGRAMLRGVEIALTKDQVLTFARKALKHADKAAFSYQSWYVRVDNIRVSPKWLVSSLTGLPVSTFHSDEARRVLAQLGMEVIRV